MAKIKKIKEIEPEPSPGKWGVWSEPVAGQVANPGWVKEPTDYESAFKHADYMNRCNHNWFYYAKPLMIKGL